MSQSFTVSADNLQLVEHLRLWGKYNIPVYRLSDCTTLELYKQFQNADTIFNFQRGSRDSMAFDLKNTYYQHIYSKVQNYANEYYGLPPQQSTIVEEENNYYGPDSSYILTEIYRVQVVSSVRTYSAGSVKVDRDDTPNYQWAVCYSNKTEPSNPLYDDIRYILFNGVPAVFLKLETGNGYVYGRARLDVFIAPLSTREQIGTLEIIGGSICNRMLTFFGGVGTEPLPLSNIQSGEITNPNEPGNPYEPGGDSTEGGGNGAFDDESDPIDIPSLPTLSSANTGFTRIYNPTLSQVKSLANYLWTDESVIQTIWNHVKQFFENPMDAIIGFNLVPVPVPDGGTESFKLMYIDTGVSMTVAANQFVDVDCGSVQLEQYYGSALDYSPYTKVSCFLPYIGNVSLNVDEVMGRALSIKYRVDICSGSCVAYISVDGTVLYQYSGHCAIPVPLSSADFSSYVTSAISVGKLAGAALVGGAGAAMGSAAQDAVQQTNQVVTTTQTTTTARNPSTGRQVTTGTVTQVQTRESPKDQSSTQASFAGLTPQNVANTVGQIMSSKPYIEHSGSFSGNSGYLGVRRPYLVIERPNMCMPANFQQFNGFPCMINLELGSCQGFTRVQQVQLTGLPATNPEQAEIMELLKSGVIF